MATQAHKSSEDTRHMAAESTSDAMERKNRMSKPLETRRIDRTASAIQNREIHHSTAYHIIEQHIISFHSTAKHKR